MADARWTTPTNIPVKATVQFFPDPPEEGGDWKEAQGRDGEYGKSYRFKLKVVSHPDLAAGTTAVWYANEHVWPQIVQLNPSKKDTITFTMREKKNEETGKTFKRLSFSLGDKEPAAPATGKPRPAAKAADPGEDGGAEGGRRLRAWARLLRQCHEVAAEAGLKDGEDARCLFIQASHAGLSFATLGDPEERSAEPEPDRQDEDEDDQDIPF